MTHDAASSTVLDTNAVFDLWLFDEPACVELHRAIEARTVRWIATRPMMEECFEVLDRGALEAWHPDRAALHATWERHCDMVDTPPVSHQRSTPRCSDPDDQMFIDLAVAHRARWLFTKDRAVLRLAPRLRPYGVEARSPDGWADVGSAVAVRRRL